MGTDTFSPVSVAGQFLYFSRSSGDLHTFSSWTAAIGTPSCILTLLCFVLWTFTDNHAHAVIKRFGIESNQSIANLYTIGQLLLRLAFRISAAAWLAYGVVTVATVRPRLLGVGILTLPVAVLLLISALTSARRHGWASPARALSTTKPAGRWATTRGVCPVPSTGAALLMAAALITAYELSIIFSATVQLNPAYNFTASAWTDTFGASSGSVPILAGAGQGGSSGGSNGTATDEPYVYRYSYVAASWLFLTWNQLLVLLALSAYTSGPSLFSPKTLLALGLQWRAARLQGLKNGSAESAGPGETGTAAAASTSSAGESSAAGPVTPAPGLAVGHAPRLARNFATGRFPSWAHTEESLEDDEGIVLGAGTAAGCTAFCCSRAGSLGRLAGASRPCGLSSTAKAGLYYTASVAVLVAYVVVNWHLAGLSGQDSALSTGVNNTTSVLTGSITATAWDGSEGRYLGFTTAGAVLIIDLCLGLMIAAGIVTSPAHVSLATTAARIGLIAFGARWWLLGISTVYAILGCYLGHVALAQIFATNKRLGVPEVYVDDDSATAQQRVARPWCCVRMANRVAALASALHPRNVLRVLVEGIRSPLTVLVLSTAVFGAFLAGLSWAAEQPRYATAFPTDGVQVFGGRTVQQFVFAIGSVVVVLEAFLVNFSVRLYYRGERAWGTGGWFCALLACAVAAASAGGLWHELHSVYILACGIFMPVMILISAAMYGQWARDDFAAWQGTPDWIRWWFKDPDPTGEAQASWAIAMLRRWRSWLSPSAWLGWATSRCNGLAGNPFEAWFRFKARVTSRNAMMGYGLVLIAGCLAGMGVLITINAQPRWAGLALAGTSAVLWLVSAAICQYFNTLTRTAFQLIASVAALAIYAAVHWVAYSDTRQTVSGTDVTTLALGVAFSFVLWPSALCIGLGLYLAYDSRWAWSRSARALLGLGQVLVLAFLGASIAVFKNDMEVPAALLALWIVLSVAGLGLYKWARSGFKSSRWLTTAAVACAAVLVAGGFAFAAWEYLVAKRADRAALWLSVAVLACAVLSIAAGLVQLRLCGAWSSTLDGSLVDSFGAPRLVTHDKNAVVTSASGDHHIAASHSPTSVKAARATVDRAVHDLASGVAKAVGTAAHHVSDMAHKLKHEAPGAAAESSDTVKSSVSPTGGDTTPLQAYATSLSQDRSSLLRESAAVTSAASTVGAAALSANGNTFTGGYSLSRLYYGQPYLFPVLRYDITSGKLHHADTGLVLVLIGLAIATLWSLAAIVCLEQAYVGVMVLNYVKLGLALLLLDAKRRGQVELCQAVALLATVDTGLQPKPKNRGAVRNTGPGAPGVADAAVKPASAPSSEGPAAPSIASASGAGREDAMEQSLLETSTDAVGRMKLLDALADAVMLALQQSRILQDRVGPQGYGGASGSDAVMPVVDGASGQDTATGPSDGLALSWHAIFQSHCHATRAHALRGQANRLGWQLIRYSARNNFSALQARLRGQGALANQLQDPSQLQGQAADSTPVVTIQVQPSPGTGSTAPSDASTTAGPLAASPGQQAARVSDGFMLSNPIATVKGPMHGHADVGPASPGAGVTAVKVGPPGKATPASATVQHYGQSLTALLCTAATRVDYCTAGSVAADLSDLPAGATTEAADATANAVLQLLQSVDVLDHDVRASARAEHALLAQFRHHVILAGAAAEAVAVAQWAGFLTWLGQERQASLISALAVPGSGVCAVEGVSDLRLYAALLTQGGAAPSPQDSSNSAAGGPVLPLPPLSSLRSKASLVAYWRVHLSPHMAAMLESDLEYLQQAYLAFLDAVEAESARRRKEDEEASARRRQEEERRRREEVEKRRQDEADRQRKLQLEEEQRRQRQAEEEQRHKEEEEQRKKPVPGPAPSPSPAPAPVPAPSPVPRPPAPGPAVPATPSDPTLPPQPPRPRPVSDQEHLRQAAAEVQSIVAKASQAGKDKWSDGSFSGPTAIGQIEDGALGRAAAQKYTWARPEQIKADGKMMVVKEGFDPSDINQGEIGDCWLLSAFAVLATRPQYLDAVLVNKQSNYAGVYGVRLWKGGQWRTVIIDDSFPVHKDDHSALMGVSSAAGDELWAMILEKAYAKYYGSYGAIVGGHTTEGLCAFVPGSVATIINLKESNIRADITSGRLFATLRGYMVNGSLLGAGSPGGSDRDKSATGIVQRHAFSILRLEEVGDSDGSYQLIQVRNPWGHTEWTGPWSDSDKKRWKARIKAKLNYDPEVSGDDGVWWMSFPDFCREYEDVYVCHVFKLADGAGTGTAATGAGTGTEAGTGAGTGLTAASRATGPSIGGTIDASTTWYRYTVRGRWCNRRPDGSHAGQSGQPQYYLAPTKAGTKLFLSWESGSSREDNNQILARIVDNSGGRLMTEYTPPTDTDISVDANFGSVHERYAEIPDIGPAASGRPYTLTMDFRGEGWDSKDQPVSVEYVLTVHSSAPLDPAWTHAGADAGSGELMLIPPPYRYTALATWTGSDQPAAYPQFHLAPTRPGNVCVRWRALDPQGQHGGKPKLPWSHGKEPYLCAETLDLGGARANHRYTPAVKWGAFRKDDGGLFRIGQLGPSPSGSPYTLFVDCYDKDGPARDGLRVPFEVVVECDQPLDSRWLDAAAGPGPAAGDGTAQTVAGQLRMLA